MDLKNFYEKMAIEYHPEAGAISSGKRRLIAHDDRFEAVTKYLDKELLNKKNIKFLDVGCGDGSYEKNISKTILYENEFYGLDISVTQQERSKTVFKRVDLLDFENEKIPFVDNFFDYVLCSEVLEHLFFPESIIKEMNRVLKPGGTLIITTPNLACLQNRLAMLFFGTTPFFDYLQNKQHIRFYTKKSLMHLIGNNFRLIKKIGINSLLFEKYIFPVRIILPYLFQKLSNKIFPTLGGGLFLIFKKNDR